jgi:hypothetical protein
MGRPPRSTPRLRSRCNRTLLFVIASNFGLDRWRENFKARQKVSPDLVFRAADGKPETVRYEAVNAMRLNEFLKDHRKMEEQAREMQKHKATISELKKEMETVVAHLKQQDSKIQKVSDQVELSKPAPQMVASRQ